MTNPNRDLAAPGDVMMRLEVRGLLVLAADIARAHGVPLESMLGRDRHKTPARARHALMRALREQELSYPEIGWLLGRDHTTVMSGCKKAAPPPMQVRVAS